ncbi:MAG: RluA family pseudouridine synthase, partial [Ferruginibacter sp.]
MAKNKFSVIAENEDWIAINKPSGLLTIPDRNQSEKSLKEILTEQFGQIFTVHRLDKDTSGLVLFAKNETAHRYMSLLFEERKVDKYYSGIVHGIPPQEEGEIEAALMESPVHKGTMVVNRNGKPSKTGYKIIEAHPAFSLVEFRLYTGRTHQIRVHCKHLGNPLACDPLYGDGKPVFISAVKKNYKLSRHEEEEKPMLNRVALHAFKISFASPGGQAITLEAAIPKEFRALMQQQQKNS